MTPKQVSEATTPNAIRQSSDDTLDGVYNYAVGHLLNDSDGIVRQMQVAIKSIQDEKLLRWNKSARKISIISLCVAILSVVLSVVLRLCTKP